MDNNVIYYYYLKSDSMDSSSQRIKLPNAERIVQKNNNMKKMREPFTDKPIYNTNKMGQLSTKGVDYTKDVPDSLLNKLRDAIRQRRKKGK